MTSQNKYFSFRNKEAEIKTQRHIIHEAAERLGEMINPELPMLRGRFNTSTGLAHAAVDHVEYDAAKLFEFIGYTLVDCNVQLEELEDGVKNLIRGQFAHIKLAKILAESEGGCPAEENQPKMEGEIEKL